MEKYYVIFAGANGAGKSTLFRSDLWKQKNRFPGELLRVNSDEILREQGGNWRSSADQQKAMKEAVKRIRQFFASSQSFNQETTLAGRKCIKDIQRAADLDYKVIMYYVGINHPDIANARIAHRASIGGHGIDPEVVHRRFDASLENLKIAIGLCDEVYLFDNSQELTLARIYQQGQVKLVRDNPEITWVERL